MTEKNEPHRLCDCFGPGPVGVSILQIVVPFSLIAASLSWLLQPEVLVALSPIALSLARRWEPSVSFDRKPLLHGD